MTPGAAGPRAHPLVGLAAKGAPLAFLETDGEVLWAGAADRLIRYDPRIEAPLERVEPFLSRAVVVDHEGREEAIRTAPGREGLPTLPFAGNHVRFEVSLPAFGDEARNEFRYRLEGLDRAWSAWSTIERKEYTNLYEGLYRLRIQARSALQPEAGEVSLAFRVLPPWYRTLPAYLAYLLAVALAVFILYRLRFHSLDRKRASLERLVGERSASLERSERRYRQLVDAVRDVIFAVRPDGTILSVSKAAEDLTGYSCAELEALPLGKLLPPEAVGVRDRLAEWRGDTCEIPIVSKAGRTVVFEVTGRRLEDAGGGALFEGVARDVSDRLRIERRLRESERLEAVGRLAGGVAHDFNNLLTVIGGHAEILQQSIEGDPSALESVGPIQTAVRRGATLAHQLLALGRRQVLQPDRVELNEIMKDHVELVRRVIPESIEVESHLEPRVGAVEVDVAEFSRVLMDLSLYARDAMPRGGVLRFDTSPVSSSEQGDTEDNSPNVAAYRVEVSDTGHGIRAEDLPHVFEPFFSPREGEPGVGLGLATAYGVVSQGGGHISVTSEVGVGSIFEIVLPAASAGELRVAVAGAVGEAGGGLETVLVVEDEEAVRRIACLVLERGGFRVLEARDSQHALAISAEFPGAIQLLLTDVLMPGMGGPELARAILAQRPATRVLFVSGHAEHTLRGVDLKSPGIAFLPKPYSPSSLLAGVRSALDTQGGSLRSAEAPTRV